MNHDALDTMLVVRSLARELALQIGVSFMPEDMAECGSTLLPLYQARRLGEMPEDVGLIIGMIEKAVSADPHYRCSDCGALFGDLDDLKPAASARTDLSQPGSIAGICPVCSGAVHPAQANE